MGRPAASYATAMISPATYGTLGLVGAGVRARFGAGLVLGLGLVLVLVLVLVLGLRLRLGLGRCPPLEVGEGARDRRHSAHRLAVDEELDRGAVAVGPHVDAQRAARRRDGATARARREVGGRRGGGGGGGGGGRPVPVREQVDLVRFGAGLGVRG